MTLAIVLKVKNVTRPIPKDFVIRQLLKGTTINMDDSVRNNEMVETRSVGDKETLYTSAVVRFINKPATPTPRRMSAVSLDGGSEPYLALVHRNTPI